jgi:hypothetical protein
MRKKAQRISSALYPAIHVLLSWCLPLPECPPLYLVGLYLYLLSQLHLQSLIQLESASA